MRVDMTFLNLVVHQGWWSAKLRKCCLCSQDQESCIGWHCVVRTTSIHEILGFGTGAQIIIINDHLDLRFGCRSGMHCIIWENIPTQL